MAKAINEDKNIEVSEIGKKFVKGAGFVRLFLLLLRNPWKFHRHTFTGVVDKQLHNSAMIIFDDEYNKSITYQDAKGKIIISYSKMQIIK